MATKTGIGSSDHGSRVGPAPAVIAWHWFSKETVAWFKEPAAVLLNMAYPLLMMVFLFVTGGDTVRKDAEIASLAVALLGLIGVLMVGINLPANGINEIRGSDFYYYIRTLPLGVGTRLAAWGGAPVLLAVLSGVTALAVGAGVSAAHYSMTQVVQIVALYLLFALCCASIGTFFGFSLSKRSSLAVSLGLAFICLLLSGGRIIADLPSALDVVARLLPSTAAAELCRSFVESGTVGLGWWISLACWLVVGCLAAAWSISLDERRKFS